MAGWSARGSHLGTIAAGVARSPPARARERGQQQAGRRYPARGREAAAVGFVLPNQQGIVNLVPQHGARGHGGLLAQVVTKQVFQAAGGIRRRFFVDRIS